MMNKTYSTRSNAKRAAVAEFGAGKFEIIDVEGQFAYHPTTAAETDGAPEAAPIKAAMDPLIEEAYEMGKKRSDAERDGAIMDAMKQGELAQDKETARAAVRKLERLKADVPTSLRDKATGSKPAKPAKSRERVTGTTAAAAAPREGSKQDRVIGLLRKPKGLSIAEMQAETGWQPHSCRGFIAGYVKVKQGLTVASEKDAKRGTVYRVAS